MKLRAFIIAALFGAFAPMLAMAQPVGSMISGYDYTNSRAKVPFVNSSGALSVFGAAAGGTVFGVDSQGAAPSVAPVTTGCVFGAYSVVATQVVRMHCDANGNLQVGIAGGTLAVTQSGAWNVGVTGSVSSTQSGTWTVQPGNTANTTPWLFNGNVTAADAAALTNTLRTYNQGGLYNGATTDLFRSVQGASTGDGKGVAGVHIVPNSNPDGAIAIAPSTAIESNHVFKASAGNLYRVALTNGASAGFLLVFNATTAPADGAVTPRICRAVQANGSVEVDHSGAPDYFDTGIVAVFSTTGCLTKTASATGFFEGSVK